MMENEPTIETSVSTPPTLLQCWVTPEFLDSLRPYIPEGETVAHVLQRATLVYTRLKQEDAAGDPSGIVAQVRSLF